MPLIRRIEALRVDWMPHDLIIDHMGPRTLLDVHRDYFDKIRFARPHRYLILTYHRAIGLMP